MTTLHHFRSGDIIIKENDVGESAYLIQKGRVRVTKESKGQDIYICDLGVGSILGEMSMIDDKPRSATVTAVEDTVVKEIHRNEFLSGLQKKQKFAVNILKILFERLRKADAMISKLKSETPGHDEALETSGCQFARKAKSGILFEGLTKVAVKTLPKNPFKIEMFPFLIGRKSRDVLVHNDLMIKDKPPYRISRHHVELDMHEDEVFVLDRGSHLGTIVQGRQLGGSSTNRGPLKLKRIENTIILGDKYSPYKYKVICEP